MCIYVFGAIQTSQGQTLTHAAPPQRLLNAVQLPSALAVCKCRAHQKEDSDTTKGNNFADHTAKGAAKGPKQVRSAEVFLVK